MADSILRLKVDSQEYDQKIKRAAEGIQQYAQKCRDAGGTLQYLDDGVLEFVQALGKMDTVATGTKQQLREMSNALTTLTQTYRGLTDEEKASPFGQELAKGIQQLTERAGQAQDAMGDVQASIRNAASDTRLFDQLSQGMSVATAGFQGLTGAGKLLGIEMGNDVEVIAKLQAAMAVTNSLTTIQTALQKQSALMQGVQAVQAAAAAAAQTSLAGATGAATVAQAAFNAVAKANPYVLLGTAIAAVGTALWAFASAGNEAKKKEEELAKAEEEATKKAQEQRDAFVNASASAMNTASRISSLQVAYKNANTEMEKTSILKQAQTEFKKLGIECKGVHDAQTLLIRDGAKIIEMIQLQGNAAALAAIRMEKFKESFKMLMENGYSASAAASLASYNKDVIELDGQINKIQGRIQSIKGTLPTSGNGPKGNNTTSTATVSDEMSLNIQKITSLSNEYVEATDERRSAIEKEIAVLQKRNEEIQKLKDMAQGKAFDAGSVGEVVVTGSKMLSVNKAFSDAPINFDSINTYISGVKDALKNADFGSDLYNSLTEKLKDATTMSTLINRLMEAGIEGADLQNISQKLREMLLSPDGIDQEQIQEWLQSINDQIEEVGGMRLKVNPETGAVEEEDDKKEKIDVEKYIGKASQFMSGISSIKGGLEGLGVKMPNEIEKAIGVMQSIVSVVQGINTVISVFQTSALTANTTAMAALTTALYVNSFSSFGFFQNGGVVPAFAEGGLVGRAAMGLRVPGNSFSGDNLRLPVVSGGAIGVNSGELILNSAQEGVLSSMLADAQGERQQEMAPYVNAETIYLGLKNLANRTGGESIIIQY